MAVTVYKSTDASAPVLDGTNGSLVNVLDACLVNGYGAKAAAGWTKPYTGANKAAYRSPTGLQYYCRVADDSPNATSLGREAVFRGYEAMTGIDTGTNPFPMIAQIALVSGLAIAKSRTADGTARPWIVVADDRTFYIFTWQGQFFGWSAATCGEFYSYKGAADAGGAIAIGRAVMNSFDPAADRLDDLTAANVAATGHYSARQVTQIAGALAVGKHGNGFHSAAALVGLAQDPAPNSGGILLNRVFVHEPSSGAAVPAVIRGHLRGFWHFLHPAAVQIADQDTFSGTGDLAGKTFIVLKPSADGSGVYVIETSAWEAN